MEPLHGAGLSLIAVALAGWSATVSGALTAGAVAFAVLFPLCAYYTGRLVLAAVRVEPVLARSVAFTFLVGYLMLGVIQFAAHTWLPGSLPGQFGVICAAAALGQLVRRGGHGREAGPGGWTELYLTAFALLAATCWARGLLRSVQFEGDQVVFHNWKDFFVHASLIWRFTAGPNLGALGHVEMCGLPAGFYHYASYLAPATQAALSGQGTYAAALCWVPLGTFLTGLAAYALVLPWAGRAGGLCAAVALLTFPDASYLWPRNGYLGYHWLQQIGVAGMYGTACGAVALTLLLQWRRQASLSALILGLAFGAATLLYKAQLFVVLAPLLGGCLALWAPGLRRRWRAALFVAFVAACVGGAALVNRLHPEPRPFGLNREYFEMFNRALAGEFKDPRWRAVLEAGCAKLGTVRYYALAVGVYALATLGPWLAAGGTFLAVVLVRRRLAAADAVPWLAVAIYLTLYATLNDYALAGHNMWELIHRPFVWVYFLFATWSAARGCQLFAATAWGRRLFAPGVVAVLCLPLLALPLRMGRHVQEGKSVCRFSCVNLRESRGLVDAARFVARTAAPLDVVQDGGCDEELIVGGLAERRSYVARPKEWARDKSPQLREEVGRRVEFVGRLKEMRDGAELGRAATAAGIRWFILAPGDAVGWPESVLGSPAFTSRGYRVYDLGLWPRRLRPADQRN